MGPGQHEKRRRKKEKSSVIPGSRYKLLGPAMLPNLISCGPRSPVSIHRATTLDMLLKTLLLPFLAVPVLAIPQGVQSIGSIEKRARPGISAGDYGAQSRAKIAAGFHEALILASYARSFVDSPDEGAQMVYEKYFPLEYKAVVRRKSPLIGFCA